MATDRGPGGGNVVSLPPLRQSAEWDTAVSDAAAMSPLRRTKKQELMAYALGKHVPRSPSPSSGFSPAATTAAAGALAAAAGGALSTAGIMLDTTAKSKQMALTSDNRQHLSGLLMESWVNQVLAGPAEQHASGLPNQQPLQPAQAAFKGLLKHGLTKAELAHAGLGAEAVDRLYRTLYVYSVGLFDTLQELLGHSPHKEELLLNVWGAYLSISESALQVAFKSEYLALASASSVAMNELLFAKEALAEAQTQHMQLARDIQLLNASHAEQAALRRALALQNQQLKSDLAREGCAHQHAVVKYVDSLEASAQQHLEMEQLAERLAALQADHEALQGRHEELRGVYGELRAQCKKVRDVFHNLNHDLRADPLLVKEMPPVPPSTMLTPPVAMSGSRPSSGQDAAGAGGTPGSAPVDSQTPRVDQDAPYVSSFEAAMAAEAAAAANARAQNNPMLAHQMGPLAEQLQDVVQTMFDQWRQAILDADEARTAMFRTKDELQAAKVEADAAADARAVLLAQLREVELQLQGSQSSCAELQQRLQAAHDLAAAAQLDREEALRLQDKTATTLADTTKKCTALEDRVYELEVLVKHQEDVAIKQQAVLDRTTARLERKHFQLQQHSRGLALAMQSLWQQQTSRLYLRQQLAATRKQLEAVIHNLEDREIRIKDSTTQIAHLQKKVEKLRGEVAALEASVRDAQGQAVALTQKLALSEGRNADLNKCYEDLQASHGQLYTSQVQTKEELDKTAANWEMTKAELGRTKETLASVEKVLLDERLKSKGLQADIHRLNQEKQDVLDRLEATKARLELTVAQLQAEMSVKQREGELLQTDLDAERDRLASVKALLEVKREKKRRWKAATKKAEEDTSTIHAKYIAKCEELLALESRLRSMDTALKLLGAGASSAGGFGPGGSNPATERSGLRSRATTRLSFMPAGAGFGLTDEAPVTKEDRTKGLLSGFHEDGRPVDVPEARKLLEEMWDELNKAAKMCGMLNDQMQDVDRQKHDLLLKLAATDASTEIAQQIGKILIRLRGQQETLQQQRQKAEEAKSAAAGRVTEAQAVMRAAVELRSAQREAILNASTMRTEDLIHAAAMAQVAAAEAAEVALQERLTAQAALLAQADKQRAALEESVAQLESGAQGFLGRINRLQSEKADLEAQLATAKDNINYLQVEVAALKAERERIRVSVMSANDKLINMQQQLMQQQQDHEDKLKEVEEAHEEELMEVQSEHEAQLAQANAQYSVLQGHTESVQIRAGQLQRVLELIALEMSALKQGSLGPPPNPLASLTLTAGTSTEGSSSPFAAGRPATPDLGAAVASTGGAAGASGTEGGAAAAAAAASGSGGEAGSNTTTSSSTRQQQQDAALWCGLWGDGGALSGSAAAVGAGGGGGSTCGTRWLHRHQTRGAWSYAQNILKQLSDEGSAGGLGALPTLLSLPPAMSIPGLLFPADSVNMMIGEIYLAKISSDGLADVAAGNDGENFVVPGHRRDLEGVVYDYMLARIGAKAATEAHLSALLASIQKYHSRHPRMRLFARLLGMEAPAVTAAGVNFTMHLLARLHAECGPLMGEATEGSSAVSCKAAMTLVETLLKGSVDAPCPEVVSLPKKLVQMAGGHKEYAIETDVLLEVALEAWLAQRTCDQLQLVEMIKQGDARSGRGLATLDDLLQLVKQANPGVGAMLTQEQLNQLFDLGLRLSGTHATTISAEGAAAALLEVGLVGSTAHTMPHALITEKPPFSEYRLLEDSWRAVRGSLQELLKNMTRPRPSGPRTSVVGVFNNRRSSATGQLPVTGPTASSILEATALQAAVKKLDDTLEAGVSAGEAWKQYRRLLAFYSIHGTFVDPLEGKRPTFKDIDVGGGAGGGLPSTGLKGGLLRALAGPPGGMSRSRSGKSRGPPVRIASRKSVVLAGSPSATSSGGGISRASSLGGSSVLDGGPSTTSASSRQ